MVCIHGDRPRYAKGLCRSCYEKQLREQNSEFAERQRENSRQWLEDPENHERKKQKNRERHARRSSDPAYKRAKRSAQLQSDYGITIEDYEAILEAQEGVCAICLKPPGKTSLHVDHDHETSAIRGLLCFRCNFGLSWFNENPENLQRAVNHVGSVWGIEE